MAAKRIIRLGLSSRRVWPVLLAGVVLGVAAVVPAKVRTGSDQVWLAAISLAVLAGGILLTRFPFVTLESDCFILHDWHRPDALDPDRGGVRGGGGVGGVPGWQSVEGSYPSTAPRDLPWTAPVPRDLVTGAAVRNGRLAVTLRERKGRSIPLQGISAEDRNALLDWFEVPSAKR